MTQISIDDYGKVSGPGEVKFSPDGEHIAFMHDGTPYIVPTDGSTHPKCLSQAGPGYENVRPAWSNDGKKLYLLYHESGDKTWEIWSAAVDDSEKPERLTRTSAEADSLRISPDGSRWLLSTGLRPIKKPETDSKPSDARPVVIDAMVFKQDGKGFVAVDANDCIYSWDMKGEFPHQLTDAYGHDTHPAWSPDGETVAFVREDLSNPQYSSHLCTIKLKPPEARGPEILTSKHPDADRRSPAWRPGGKQIAYIWRDKELGPYAVPQIAVCSANGKSEKVITEEHDRTISSFQYSHDGKFIYFLYDHEGCSHLARIRLKGNEITPLVTCNVYISSFDLNESGDIALTMNNMNDGADVYVIRAADVNKKDGEPPMRLTNLNPDYFGGRRQLGQKESIFYSPKNGPRIQALITKPPNFDPGTKYPAILRIHGGPIEQASVGYDFAAQYYAANGYVVVEPNPPGSTGRGQEFIKRVREDWGYNDYPDVLGAIDKVVELGYVDPDKLAVIGFSYGGYMTNCIITVAPDKFKAAVSGAGHSLIAANYGHDIYLKWYNWGLGHPWIPEVRKRYEKLSPLYHAGSVKTPTLFMCGAQDWNVPILNSELFYQALRVRGVPTQFVVYPKAAHNANWDVGDYQNGKDYYERVVKWLDKWVKNP